MLLAAFWIIAGTATVLWLIDDAGDDPWWLTALLILSWPILAATQFIGITVIIQPTEGDD